MLTEVDLLDMFDVDLERGLLVWKNPPYNHPRLRGVVAGCPQLNRWGKLYWVIKIRGTAYKRGRLIYLLHHHRWPVPCVDHENGDSLDDAASNLREATILQNNQNVSYRPDRRSLPLGVRIAKNRYQARISIDKTSVSLGCFDTPDEAHRAYIDKRKEIFGEFSGNN